MTVLEFFYNFFNNKGDAVVKGVSNITGFSSSHIVNRKSFMNILKK